jgi:hypothetical protein
MGLVSKGGGWGAVKIGLFGSQWMWRLVRPGLGLLVELGPWLSFQFKWRCGRVGFMTRVGSGMTYEAKAGL